MKIVAKHLITYPLIIYLSITAITAGLIYKSTENPVIENIEGEIKKDIFDRASNGLAFALQQTEFIPKQREIDKYSKANTETCSIDITEQEFGQIFGQDEKELYVLYPYISPKSKKWVFTYVGPIVMDDGSKTGAYHYEAPLSQFQETIAKESVGRTFVLDSSGLIIADSGQEIDTKLKEGANPEEQLLKDYLPTTDSISTTAQFMTIVTEMREGKEGCGTYVENDVTYYVAYKPLAKFGWSIGQIKPYSEAWL
ncbi:MAG: hypothetical protein V3U19_04815 [Thermodesulfobacteriota bacterium]